MNGYCENPRKAKLFALVADEPSSSGPAKGLKEGIVSHVKHEMCGRKKKREMVSVCSVTLPGCVHIARMVLGVAVPLVGPQEQLRGPSAYTPRGLSSNPRRKAKIFGFYNNKKKGKKKQKRVKEWK